MVCGQYSCLTGHAVECRLLAALADRDGCKRPAAARSVAIAHVRRVIARGEGDPPGGSSLTRTGRCAAAPSSWRAAVCTHNTRAAGMTLIVRSESAVILGLVDAVFLEQLAERASFLAGDPRGHRHVAAGRCEYTRQHMRSRTRRARVPSQLRKSSRAGGPFSVVFRMNHT